VLDCGSVSSLSSDECSIDDLVCCSWQRVQAEEAKKRADAMQIAQKAMETFASVRLSTETRSKEWQEVRSAVQRTLRNVGAGLTEDVRKTVKRNIVQLEKDTVELDSVNLSALAPDVAVQLKSARKESVQSIQELLGKFDELEKHIAALDKLLTFVSSGDR
jgi:hypothetical protein